MSHNESEVGSSYRLCAAVGDIKTVYKGSASNQNFKLFFALLVYKQTLLSFAATSPRSLFLKIQYSLLAAAQILTLPLLS